jgi:hypothetical protein
MYNPYNPWDPYGAKEMAAQREARTRAVNAEILKNMKESREAERQIRSGLGPSGPVSGGGQRSGGGLFRFAFWCVVAGGGLLWLFS